MDRSKKLPGEVARGDALARLPSGKLVGVRDAVLVVGKMTEEDEGVQPALMDGERLLILDPRAMVAVGDRLAYHPRAERHLLAPWARAWLDENPDWAPTVTFQGDAAGAFPRGSRVRKCHSEPGDGHKDGDEGVVQGSERPLPDGPLLYQVLWDAEPRGPLALMAHRVELTQGGKP